MQKSKDLISQAVRLSCGLKFDEDCIALYLLDENIEEQRLGSSKADVSCDLCYYRLHWHPLSLTQSLLVTLGIRLLETQTSTAFD